MSPPSTCTSNGFGLVTGTSTPPSTYQFAPTWVRKPGVSVMSVWLGPGKFIGWNRFADR